MSHFNSLPLLLVLLYGSVTIKAEVPDALESSERIVAEAKAKDPSTSTRTVPPQYDDVSALEKLSEADFANMNASDPRLKTAWVDLVLGLPGGFPTNLSRTDPEVVKGGHRAAAFFDLIRRGDSATPILLELARELEETPFESGLLEMIDTLQGVNLAPFLSYSRNLLLTRPKSSKIVSAALLLGRHGTTEDVLLLEKVAASRPYFADTIRKEAKALKAHIDGERARVGSPATKANPPTLSVQSSSPKKAPEVKPTTSTPSEEPFSSTPWSVIVILIVVATGLLWLLVKNRK